MPYSLVWKKVALVPPLVFALWLLADDDPEKAHHLAVVTALQRHPPSLRVYRALLELTFLLAGTALSLHVWSKAAGTKVVGFLLFQPPFRENAQRRGSYRRVSSDENDPLGDQDEQDHPSRTIMSEEGAFDACYDSDGEISEPSMAGERPEPPKAGEVASAALDLLIVVLVSLFLFTLASAEGGRYIQGMQHVTAFQGAARIAAPVFPLVLFVLAAAMTMVPWTKRRDFWVILSYTISAPFCEVTFRDGFIGDILTSSVRPMQDLAFTTFYVISGLRGWWTQSYDLDDAAMPLERSWLLHTAILPACMVSPLWWRFLQNLRQSYDNKKRWPYLGNALKYFVAAQVAMFGVFDPLKKQNVVWILSFVAATLYQTWWDIIMDWELLEFRSNGFPKLRSSRLYPSNCMYWTILVVNFMLRFGWTLSFLPTLYLHRSGALTESFSGNFSNFIGPVIASAEIGRRTLWGFLRLELEAIKVCRDDEYLKAQLIRCSDKSRHDMEIEMKTLSYPASNQTPATVSLYASLSGGHTWSRHLQSDISTHSDLQILAELCLWATVFTSLGMVAAAHRETM